LLFQFFFQLTELTLAWARCSVRRPEKNIDSSSKSNPLRCRGKKYDASTWRRRHL